jgi:lipopolysaccharide transport system ATP-binding protein
MPPAIRVSHVSKSYRISHAGARHDTFTDAFADLIRRSFRWGSSPQASDEIFWALREVSFEVQPGEVVGIIGKNGAGKSTLLKILSRITAPTEGRVEIRGRVASLLEVGTGFHPELTGRENVYMNGSILGMARADIDRKFDAIVDFAGVERFLDTPLKRYSSGMQVRLAFAVAAHLEPEVLIVDEVLAVGDAAFQRKCLGKMESVSRGGRTVLFVSHQMAAVESLCTRAVLLSDGRVVQDGPTADTLRTYLASALRLDGRLGLSTVISRTGAGELRIEEVTLWGSRQGDVPRTGDDLHIGLTFRGEGGSARPSRVGFSVASALGIRLLQCSTELSLAEPPQLGPGSYLECCVPTLPLSGGRYTLSLFLEQAGIVQDWIPDVCEFEVVDGDFFGQGRNAPSGHEGRTVLVRHAWTVGRDS